MPISFAAPKSCSDENVGILSEETAFIVGDTEFWGKEIEALLLFSVDMIRRAFIWLPDLLGNA